MMEILSEMPLRGYKFRIVKVGKWRHWPWRGYVIQYRKWWIPFWHTNGWYSAGSFPTFQPKCYDNLEEAKARVGYFRSQANLPRGDDEKDQVISG